MTGPFAVEECLFLGCRLPCRWNTDSIIPNMAVRPAWPLQEGHRREKDNIFLMNVNMSSFLRSKGKNMGKKEPAL